MSLLWFYLPTQRVLLTLSSLPPFSSLLLLSFLSFSLPTYFLCLPPSLLPYILCLSPSLPPSLPPSLGIHHHFSEQPEDTTVGQGTTALLRCHLSDSNPPAIYRWKKDGHPISPDNDRVVLSPSGYLYIRNVTDTDEGEYQCLAENEVSGKTRRSRVSSLSVNGETTSPLFSHSLSFHLPVCSHLCLRFYCCLHFSIFSPPPAFLFLSLCLFVHVLLVVFVYLPSLSPLFPSHVCLFVCESQLLTKGLWFQRAFCCKNTRNLQSC